MRTSRTNLTLILCFICLSCHVQQCNLLALGLLTGANAAANAAQNTASNAMTLGAAAGMNLVQSMLHSVASTMMLGITTFQTMALSLLSGFVMGVMALSGFIFFLLTLVPAEEYRGIGVASAAKLSLQNRFPLLNNGYVYSRSVQNHSLIFNATSEEPSFLRNFSLNSKNATFSSFPRSKRSTLVKSNVVSSNDTSTLSLESIAKVMNASDERIPRFLSRFVQRDPLNCLPLIMCGLNAAARPNERTETLNDMAYLMKELLEDVADKDDKSEVEDDSSAEDDVFTEGKISSMKSKSRSPLDFLFKKHKKKDEVDEMIDQMHKEEDDKIEETVLTELADDPNDLKFALEEMKLKGLKKTMGKMSEDARRKYMEKLIREDSSREDEEGEDLEEYEGPPPMSMMDYRGRHQYPGPEPDYEEYGHYYEPERLVRGGYPPPPPLPPVPEYGSGRQESDEFYKRKLNVKKGKGPSKGKKGSSKKPSSKNKVLIATPMPHRHRQSGGNRRRTKRDNLWSSRGARAYLQKKRGELSETNDLYDRARIAAEIGSVARNNRQCRAFFQGCPSMEKKKPSTSSSSSSSSRTKTIGPLASLNKNKEADTDSSGTTEAPFLNRAVNNIRRVLLGPDSVSTKAKRVNEIKEVIQQIHPPANHGGSEVKVVLNIGPSGAPQVLTSGTNGVLSPVLPLPAQHYMQIPQYPTLTSQELGLPPPFSAQLIPQQTDRYVVARKPTSTTTSRPKTTPKPPPSKPTKKVMKYMNPASSTSASKKPLPPLFSVPPTELDKLANFLKTTSRSPSVNSGEEGGTTIIFDETETTISPAVVFSDVASESEEAEKSVEEDLEVIPTKYPMSKEEYAENLRETFNIFNRFKEAHRNTPPPPTTAEAPLKGQSLAGVKTTKRTPGTSGSGPQSDTAQGDVQGQGQGEEDIGQIWGNIKDSIKDTWNKIRNKRKKKKKKKPSKDDDSSEESSEEEYVPLPPPKDPPLVAVPHPHDRIKIHWRSGTQLLTDKFYHLFFGKRVVKPLPDSKHGRDEVPEYYSGSKEDHVSGKPHLKDDKDHTELDIQKGRKKTQPKVQPQKETQTKKTNATSSPGKRKNSKGNSKKSGSGPVLLIAKVEPTPATTPKSKKPKPKPKGKGRVKAKPSPTPEDDEDDLTSVANTKERNKVYERSPSRKSVNRSQEMQENSAEEEEEEEEEEDQAHEPEPSEESNEYPEYNSSRPKPKKETPSSSDSDEYDPDPEEEADDDSEGEVYETGQSETTKPKLVYNPFSVEASSGSNSHSNIRGRMGLESSESPERRKSSKKKDNERKKSKPKTTTPSPFLPAKIKFSDLYGPKGVGSSSFSSRVMKTSRTPPINVTTVKPKRKVLRYKNG